MKHLAIVVLAVLSVMLCASAIQAQTTPVYLESTQTLLNKSLTFTGGETLVADDGTNVVLTLSDRAASNVRIVMAGTTNVAADALTIEVVGNDLWGTNTTYMSLALTLDDTASGSMDSSLALTLMVAGTATEVMDTSDSWSGVITNSLAITNTVAVRYGWITNSVQLAP